MRVTVMGAGGTDALFDSILGDGGQDVSLVNTGKAHIDVVYGSVLEKSREASVPTLTLNTLTSLVKGLESRCMHKGASWRRKAVITGASKGMVRAILKVWLESGIRSALCRR